MADITRLYAIKELEKIKEAAKLYEQQKAVNVLDYAIEHLQNESEELKKEKYEYCLKSIEKLEQIGSIINEWNDDWQASQKDLWMYLADIKEVLEQE